MPYGYIGQNLPNQTKSNSGVFSISDVADLEKQGKFGGSLELIEEQTISSAFADFTLLQESKYDVHKFELINVVPNSADNIGLRFSNNGGTSYTATGYQYAWQRGYPSTFTEIKSTSSDRIQINGSIGTGTNDALNGYVYCYNLGNSSKYSFITQQTIGSLSSSSIYALFSFGGGVLPTAETHNAVRFGTGSFNVLGSGTIKLYGVKQL